MGNVTKALGRWKEVILITAITKLVLIILYPATSSWIHWDSPHYLDIARFWYQTTGESSLWIVFYPLYPILIKSLASLINNFNLSAILISHIFAFIASISLFELAHLDYDKKIALKSVWFLNIFPTSYFFQAAYTESLFLSLSILSIYFFRKNYFLVSGFWGSLATFTRPNGLLISSLLFNRNHVLKSLLTVFLTSFGLFFYLLINYQIFHDPFYFTKPLFLNWYKHFDWPWIGIYNLIHSVPAIQSPDFYVYFSEIVAIAFILIVGIYSYFKTKLSYTVYIFLNLLLFTSTSFILSTPRYILSIFPIFITLGTIKSKFITTSLSFLFIALLYYLSNLFTGGKWAY